MFRYTKKIVTAASVLAFCSGQLYAMEVDKTDDEGKVRNRTAVVAIAGDPDPRSQSCLPYDTMKLIFAEACKNGANPRYIELVCKYWYDSMRHIVFAKEGVRYTTLTGNYFMEDCMREYRENLVFGATLYYNKGQVDEKAILFSEFENGTANLKGCGDEAKKQVYTYNRTRFLEVGGDNAGKLVTYIGPRHWVEDLLPQQAGGNAANRCKDVVHSVAILWRPGNWETESGFDYAASCPIADLSASALYEIWDKKAFVYECENVFKFVCKPK